MKDDEPAGLGVLAQEVSRMLHDRAQRHPDHTDPIGITRRDLKAARGRRRAGLAVAATLVVAGGTVVGVQVGGGSSADKVTPAGSAADYTAAATCPDGAKVPVDIPRGATGPQIANTLYAAGVVKSPRAYLDAANQNQGSAGITAGTYALCPQISGSNAVLELLKKSNLTDASQIIVTPHEWAKDVIASLIDKRKWKQADFDAAIAGNTIGLPAWSVNRVDHTFTVEGMLEPGTYTITSADTPQSILSQMVAHRMAFLKGIDFEAKAQALTCGPAKCTPDQVLIVASIAEGEVTDPSDASKVAEGIYSRLKAGDYLGIDSTALYFIGHLPNGTLPTAAQVRNPSNPYSTYAPHHGLPPTPVYMPSDDMIKAALAPTAAGVYYWCLTTTGTEFYKESQQSARDKDCASSK